MKQIKYILTLIFLSAINIAAVSKEASEKVTIPLKLTKDLCNELVIDALPQEDVAYKEGVDVDGNKVESAELSGGIKIRPPKEITIPIRLDVTKYLRPTPTKTAASLETLTQSRNAITQATNQLANTANQINSNLLNTSESLSAAQNILSQANLDATSKATAAAQLTTSLQQLQSLVQELGTSPTLINTVTQTLSSQAPLLTQQFTAYQTDPSILQRINILQNDSLNAIGSAQTAITQNVQALDAVQQNLSNVQSMLTDNQSKLNANDVQLLQSAANSLQQTVANTQEQFQTNGITIGDNSQSNQLNVLNNQYSQIGVQPDKNVLINYADIGTVKVKENGEIYFNDQPLFNEQQMQIRKACEKLLKQG
ncbi:hypothetical protein [Candidatus Nucleicultrix amoebiphila]|uniref:Uncharacterized protein n=1 Tax=Candidatus Nucleicultrix amoebiphila FS5 TaxID=1414854 RepID=A0A1W6N322_9PROT|nr:hypothetical protein [Candidatus Nucleicultrix amoebiphila]ARN84166.1 hypothetical protein GQ61_01085 [Candidatus Nucleicultrix amoebiphila FS5]